MDILSELQGIPRDLAGDALNRAVQYAQVLEGRGVPNVWIVEGLARKGQKPQLSAWIEVDQYVVWPIDCFVYTRADFYTWFQPVRLRGHSIDSARRWLRFRDAAT